MPSTSKKQARFMAAAAHDPKFAKKAGVPEDVAEEFHESDKAPGGFYGAGSKKASRKKGGLGNFLKRSGSSANGTGAGGVGGAGGGAGG